MVDGVEGGLDVMASTVSAGLAADQKIMLFVDSLSPAAVWAGLEERGIAVGPARRAGQVRVLTAREAYLPEGRFDPPGMLHSLVDHVDQAAREGYPGLRLVGDMAWVLDGPPGADLLAGYEAQVNQFYMDGRAMGVCLYDQRVFPTSLVRQVAGAHPASSTGGVSGAWTPLLRIRRTTDPYGLRLTGEADLSNRQAVTATLDAVLDQQPDPAAPIHVDVAGLRFADAATAALLGRLALRAPAGVRLAGATPALTRTLHHLAVTQLSTLKLTGGGPVGTETVT